MRATTCASQAAAVASVPPATAAATLASALCRTAAATIAAMAPATTSALMAAATASPATSAAATLMATATAAVVPATASAMAFTGSRLDQRRDDDQGCEGGKERESSHRCYSEIYRTPTAGKRSAPVTRAQARARPAGIPPGTS
jgi:hypothetical protein